MIDNRKRASPVLIFALCFLSVVMLYSIGRPASYIWVMDVGDLKNEFYLVKMCPTGKQLLRIQFGQSEAIGIDPRENIVWAPEIGDVDDIHYNQVVKVDRLGNVIDRFQGYGSPVLAVDPNDGSVWVSSWSAVESEGLLTKIAPNGKLIRKVGGFNTLYSIALDPRDGSIWAADGGSRTLTHISASGEKLFEMPGIFFHCLRRRRAEVPQQPQRAYPALGRLERPMEILAIKTGPIEKFHQPIHQVAGAMGIDMIITLHKLRPFGAQIQRMAFHRAVW